MDLAFGNARVAGREDGNAADIGLDGDRIPAIEPGLATMPMDRLDEVARTVEGGRE